MLYNSGTEILGPGTIRRRGWFVVGLTLLMVGTGLVAFPLQPPAQAGIFDFLVGGRENRRGRAPDRDKGGAVRSGRLAGGIEATIPYIITPRNTFQEGDQFEIRWNPVPAADRYRVRLWQWEDANGGRQQVIWETTTTETAVAYAGNPPLAPESFYSAEVITDQGISSDLDAGCPISGFALLFPDTRAELQTDLRAIDSGLLSPEELALARAEVYLNYQMPETAIAILASQFDQTPSAPLTLALADLYSYAGLNALAIEHYTQGLNLAEVDQNDLWQAIALEGLGEVNATFNQIETALPMLQQAKTAYTRANQRLSASLMEQRIALLQLGQHMGIQPNEDLQGCEPRDINF